MKVKSRFGILLLSVLCVLLCGLGTASFAGEAVLFYDGRYLEIESHELSIIDGSIRLNLAGGAIWVQKAVVKRIEDERGIAWENAEWTQRDTAAQARRVERRRSVVNPVAGAPKVIQQMVLSAWADNAPIIRQAGR